MYVRGPTVLRPLLASAGSTSTKSYVLRQSMPPRQRATNVPFHVHFLFISYLKLRIGEAGMMMNG